MRHLEDYIDVKQAVQATSTSGAVTGLAIDTTGFARARFVFALGGTADIGRINASSIGIWQAATSGGTYTAIGGAYLAAITSGAISSGGCVAVIDVPTDADTEWLKVSGSVTSSNMFLSAICELYNGISNPPTSSANQVVSV